MNEQKEKRNKKLEMKLNPSYVSLLYEIADTYGIKNVNTLVDMILNGKHLSRSQSGRDSKKITDNVGKQSTQSINIVKQVIKNAEELKLPQAKHELKDIKTGFRITHKTDDVDVLEIFQNHVEELSKAIGKVITLNVKYETDTSKEAARFKRRLSEIDVNARLPRKRNYYSRHTTSVYANNFKNNGVFKAGERPDAYNRRALKHSLATKAEFMIEHVNPEQFKLAFDLLTRWNTINHKINLSFIEGGTTGIEPLFKEILSLIKKANEV